MSPKSNHIFLSPIEKRLSSVLIVPPKYEYKSKEFLSGRVESIGRLVNQVEIGDEVAYAKDAGIEVEFEDRKYIVIQPKSILAVV